MKKIYSQLELELFVLTEDIVSTSITYENTYGQEDFAPGTKTDNWFGDNSPS